MNKIEGGGITNFYCCIFKGKMMFAFSFDVLLKAETKLFNAKTTYNRSLIVFEKGFSCIQVRKRWYLVLGIALSEKCLVLCYTLKIIICQ